MVILNDPIFLENLSQTMDSISNGVALLEETPAGELTCFYFNDHMASSLGYSREEFRTLVARPLNVVDSADYGNVQSAISRALHYDDEMPIDNTATGRMISKSGERVWTLGHYHKCIFMNRPCIMLITTNVSELVGIQTKLEADVNKWFDIINSVPIGLTIFNSKGGKYTTIAINDNLVDFANEIGRQLDGISRCWTKEEIAILLNQNIYAFCTDEDRTLVKAMLDDSDTGLVSECVFRLRGSNLFSTVYVKSTCFSKPAADDSRNYYVTYASVTKEKMQEKEISLQQAELYRMSYHDALTGVKNRNAYNIFMDEVRRNKLKNVGIAFADLNGLKAVNDTLGHGYGDGMFITFVELVRKAFDSIEIFRISGDEFVLIKPDISKNGFQQHMRTLINNIAKKGNIASVGYIWKDSITDVKMHVKRAEDIMYIEKQRFYEDKTTFTSKHRPKLLNNLLEDIDNHRYTMYLQPKCDINTQKVVGAEALVRKFDYNGNIVPPYEFIPILEKERLIPKIDLFMFEETCKFLESLKYSGVTDFKVSVNMSRITLVEDNYINVVSDLCKRYDFNLNQLEFEITESNETMDNNRLEDYLRQIRDLGISVSLDDVGTEYSSFPMLILDGIDTVKLDRSLILQLGNKKAQKMLSHIIDMCHDMGLKVIAEGVETDAVRLELAGMGCDQYQGYLMSKPIPSDEFRAKFL